VKTAHCFVEMCRVRVGSALFNIISSAASHCLGSHESFLKTRILISTSRWG